MGRIARFLGNLRIWPGPVLAVELVTTARRTRYFVIRALYAAALFFALWITHQANLGSGPPDMNAMARFTAAFFGTFGVMQLLAVMLIGPALAAGTIALEHERRTIEYLFATPLSNLEIVTGKLGGRVLQILYLVLSGLPVLALAMLLGGIAPRAVVTLTVVTLSTVLFVTMLSLAVSACTTKARDAVIRAYLLFFCLWVLPPVALGFLEQVPPTNWWVRIVEQFVIPNPIFTFLAIFAGNAAFRSVTDPWWLLMNLVVSQMLVGGTALLVATLFMRRVKPARSKRRWRIQFFRGAVGDNPLYWKELFAESGSSRLGLLGYALIALIFVSVCGLTLYVFLESVGRSYAERSFCEYATGMSTFLCCCGLLLLATRAAGSITSEKERDCWDSLVSTPLEPRQIVMAKILGSFWSLRGLMPFLAVVWLPALVLRPAFYLAISATVLNLVILSAFISALGVFYSQRAKSTLRAMAATLGTILFIGGGYLFCTCLPMSLVAMGMRGGESEAFLVGLAPCMPFLLLWPGMTSLQFDSTSRSWSDAETWVLVAYVIGTIGYAVSAVVLMFTAIEQFDAKSGRTRGRSANFPPRPPRVARRVPT